MKEHQDNALILTSRWSALQENVLVDTKSYLSSIVNMKVVSNLGSYLGLSSKFQRGKSKDFKFLLDKIWTIL